MVERLKVAINKAREIRGGAPSEAMVRPSRPTSPSAVAERWERLEELTLNPAHLNKERVVSFLKSDPAHVVFDVLRTRLLKVFKDNGWSRLAITSPTKGCGKTFVSCNLALSLARQPDVRTMLIDMDLKAPRIASCLGLKDPRSIAWFLTGQTAPEAYLRRIGPNLALGLNTERVRDSAELIGDDVTAATLTATRHGYAPDLTIFDLPPILVSDDAIAFLPQVDAVLLVVAAGETRPDDIAECERLLGDNTNFLGVLLNKCEAKSTDAYQYAYR